MFFRAPAGKMAPETRRQRRLDSGGGGGEPAAAAAARCPHSAHCRSARRAVRERVLDPRNWSCAGTAAGPAGGGRGGLARGA
jgi:hypothetical protein